MKNEMENKALSQADRPRTLKRIWIPLLLLPLMIVARFVPEFFQDGPSMIWAVAAFGPFLIGALIGVWWLFASGVLWRERLGALVGLVAVLAAVIFLMDRTMRDAPVIVMTIPLAVAGFTLGALFTARQTALKRTGFALILAFLASGFSALLRTDGVWGDFAFGLDWRWNASAEDKFLAERNPNGQPSEGVTIPVDAFQKPEWPGFRGPNRDGAQHGYQFNRDWKASPPVELWRIKVGPAWSSIAVAGDYWVTQEQRGKFESVVCYRTDNGSEVWARNVESRFFEALGGLGPRATPTISNGFVFAMGAEGWLLKLDATNGEVVWKIDLRKIADRAPPMWGFSSSPLVTQGLVIVHAAGAKDKGLVAFDEKTGDLKWSVAASEMSYGSPQTVELLGRPFVGLLTDSGAQFHEIETGQLALEHAWKHPGYRALQPCVVDPSQFLIPTGLGSGTRLVKIQQNDGKLSTSEVWTSRDLKSDFNDLVVHKGFAFGFDNQIFCCIDLENGRSPWKDGRYGKGQVLLLADSDLLLVISEKGELVLLEATGAGHRELAKIKAVEGKTWNHPVVVGKHLFVRNAAEAVAYELPVVEPLDKHSQPE